MHKFRLSLVLLPLLVALILPVGQSSTVYAQASQTCNFTSSLKIGETAWLSALPEYSVPLYESASDQSAVIGAIAGGEIVSILEGPICNLRDVWWRVEYDDIIGWVLGAKVAMDYGMEVVSYNFDPITPCVSRFTVGDQAEGFDYGPRPIRAERDPWRGAILAEPDENALLNIVGEPVCSQYNRVLWVEVEWNGVRGWTQEWAHADQCDFYCASDLNIYLRPPLDIADPLPLDAAVERVRELAVTPPTHPNSLTRDDFSRLEVLSQIGQGEIIDFALSPTLPDSTQLAIVGTIEVLIYNLLDLTAPIHTINAHVSTPTTALYSPDGQTLVTADARGDVYLWDTQTFAQLANIERHERINTLAYSQDSTLLAVATGEGVSIWDVQPPDEISLIYTSDDGDEDGDGDGATALEFIGDSHRLAAFGNAGGSVIDADTATIIPLENLAQRGPTFNIMSWDIYGDSLIAFISQSIATDGLVSREYFLTGWDLVTGEEWQFPRDYTAWGSTTESRGRLLVAFNPVTGQHLVNLKDTQQFEQVESIIEMRGGGVNTLAYSPDGSLVVFGREDGVVLLYHGDQSPDILPQMGGSLEDVRFSADGAYVVGRGSDNAVHVWDVEKRESVGMVKLMQLTNPLAVSADDTLLYSDFQLWDLATAQPVEAFKDSEMLIPEDVYFLPDNTPIITHWVYGDPSHINFQDLRTREVLLTYTPLPTEFAGFFKFSPDNTYVADIDESSGLMVNGVIVFEVATGREMLHIERSFSNVYPKALTNDGRLLAVMDSGREHTDDSDTLTIWDVDTGDLLFSYPHYYFDVVFSPTNTIMAWEEDERIPGTFDTAQAWFRYLDLISQEVHTFGPLEALVRDFTFSPDGSVVAAGDMNGQLYIWDLENGTEILRVQAHNGPVDWLAFAADGSRLYSFSREGIVKIWGLKPE